MQEFGRFQFQFAEMYQQIDELKDALDVECAKVRQGQQRQQLLMNLLTQDCRHRRTAEDERDTKLMRLQQELETERRERLTLDQELQAESHSHHSRLRTAERARTASERPPSSSGNAREEAVQYSSAVGSRHRAPGIERRRSTFVEAPGRHHLQEAAVCFDRCSAAENCPRRSGMRTRSLNACRLIPEDSACWSRQRIASR